MVQQGKTVVAQLKATDHELALAEAEAELARAETALKLKRGLRREEIDEKRAEVQERKTWVDKYAKDLERAQSLRTRDIASASDYDLAQSTYLASKAQYERTTIPACRRTGSATRGYCRGRSRGATQARAQRLRADVQRTTIQSPVSGFITRRYTEVGQWIERGGKAADIIDLRSCWCASRCTRKTLVAYAWAMRRRLFLMPSPTVHSLAK